MLDIKKIRGDLFAHERKDCTVLTLSIVLEISYSEAHKILKDNGREDRHGFSFKKIYNKIPEYKFIKLCNFPKKVKQLPEFLPYDGAYAVHVKEHVLAYKDRKIFDMIDSQNQDILAISRIIKI